MDMTDKEINRAYEECLHCNTYGLRNATKRCPHDCKNRRFFELNMDALDGTDESTNIVLVDPDVSIEEDDDECW